MKIAIILVLLTTFTSAQLEIGAGSQGEISSNLRKCQMLHNYEKVNGEIQLQITITPPEPETMVMYIMSGNPCIFGNEVSSDGHVVYYDYGGNQRPVGSFNSVSEVNRIDFNSLNEAFNLTGKYNNLCVFACQIAPSLDGLTYSYSYDVEIVSYVENIEPSLITHTITGQQCYNTINMFSSSGIIANVNISSTSNIHILLAVGNDCGPIYSTTLYNVPKNGPGSNRLTSTFSFIDVNNVSSAIQTPKISDSFYCYYLCTVNSGTSARVVYNISILELDPSQSVSFRDVEGVATAVSQRAIETLKNDTVEIVTEIVDGQVTIATASFSKRLQAVESKQESGSKVLSIEWIALIIGIIGIVVGLAGLGVGSYAVHQLRKKSSSKIELA